MDRFFYDNVVLCRIDKNDAHILREPRVLPCGNTACLDCIQRRLEKTGNLNCEFETCQQAHQIKSAKNLPTNVTTENALRDNCRTLIDFLLAKLQKSIQDLRGFLVISS